MTKNGVCYLFSIVLIMVYGNASATAKSWLAEGAVEFEKLRLRQLQTVQQQGKIKPFVTDGCSGYQSQNWEALAEAMPGFDKHFGDKPPWEHCCVVHDRAYWRGEVRDGHAKRKAADEALKQCVIDTGGKLAPDLSARYSLSQTRVRQLFSLTADLMFRAVRMGGLPCSLLPWRWGYGWDHCAFAALGGPVPDRYSDLKDDEHVVFFNTSAWLDGDGTHWNVPIHAWIYEPEESFFRLRALTKMLKAKYDLKPTTRTRQNLRDRANLLLAESEEDKRLVIRIAGQDVALPESAENGHVHKLLKLPVEVVNAFSNQGRLHYFAVMDPADGRRFQGEIALVPKAGVGVISDIDDTVKITEVHDHRELFRNTFFNDFKAVPGMAELYGQLAAKGASFHFVSSSPWQLYTPLQQLLRQAHFPRATMSLKKVRFTDKTFFNLFKNGLETKPAQIEPILKRYPKRKFILIGDNGEQDPEVYGDIARRYDAQVSQILIRNVDGGDREDERYRKAFKGITKDKWLLFKQPGSIDLGLMGKP